MNTTHTLSERQSANLDVYDDPQISAHYGEMKELTHCEQVLFDEYVQPHMSVLDLGVGRGRTTPYLSRHCSHYVGLDYSEEMIRVCRNKFPDLQFEVADAADLSRFADSSFDVVVFSFNGLDYIAPDEERRRCLKESYRVLKRGGFFICSTHNPRALVVAFQWDRERIRRIAKRISGRATVLFHPTLAALMSARLALALLRTGAQSALRAYRRLPSAAFWRGEGYIIDPTHGGLLTHFAIPFTGDRRTDEVSIQTSSPASRNVSAKRPHVYRSLVLLCIRQRLTTRDFGIGAFLSG